MLQCNYYLTHLNFSFFYTLFVSHDSNSQFNDKEKKTRKIEFCSQVSWNLFVVFCCCCWIMSIVTLVVMTEFQDLHLNALHQVQVKPENTYKKYQFNKCHVFWWVFFVCLFYLLAVFVNVPIQPFELFLFQIELVQIRSLNLWRISMMHCMRIYTLISYYWC